MVIVGNPDLDVFPLERGGRSHQYPNPMPITDDFLLVAMPEQHQVRPPSGVEEFLLIIESHDGFDGAREIDRAMVKIDDL